MKYSYYQRLKNMCDAKNSYLCIGLDFDLDKMKNKNVKNLVSLESFIKDVIDSTYDLCAAYKPNFAFFEKYGPSGMKLLESVVEHIDYRSLQLLMLKEVILEIHLHAMHSLYLNIIILML